MQFSLKMLIVVVVLIGLAMYLGYLLNEQNHEAELKRLQHEADEASRRNENLCQVVTAYEKMYMEVIMFSDKPTYFEVYDRQAKQIYSTPGIELVRKKVSSVFP